MSKNRKNHTSSFMDGPYLYSKYLDLCRAYLLTRCVCKRKLMTALPRSIKSLWVKKNQILALVTLCFCQISLILLIHVNFDLIASPRIVRFTYFLSLTRRRVRSVSTFKILSRLYVLCRVYFFRSLWSITDEKKCSQLDNKRDHG